jgi:hypothetical protein
MKNKRKRHISFTNHGTPPRLAGGDSAGAHGDEGHVCLPDHGTCTLHSRLEWPGFQQADGIVHDARRLDQNDVF